MHRSTAASLIPPSAPGRVARLGRALREHQGAIAAIQWCVVLAYLVLLLIPPWLPQPGRHAHLYDDLRLLAQFVFWGVWWPSVILATMLAGRAWCGLFCPEGTLNEWASRRAANRSIPRWMRWPGWPLAAFVGLTVYGQLVGVYRHPLPALLILGCSTAGAVAVGLRYGRRMRLWCKYLCPVNGVFGLLAKVAPLHFRVDEEAWKRCREPQVRVNCAPLIDIRHMKSASACHACGRCAGHRDAVELALRSPAQEILQTRSQDTNPREALLLIFGMIGIASATFLWADSRWLAQTKAAAAAWLQAHGAAWALEANAPWWLLAHHPEAGLAYTWLDGAAILGFILGGGALLGALTLLAVRLAARLGNDPALSWPRLALALVPLAGAGIGVGLSLLTVAQLQAMHMTLAWMRPAQLLLLAAGSAFSAWLGWKLLAGAAWRRLPAFAVFCLPVALFDWLWLTSPALR
jgi:polyferredoxin